MPKNISSGDCRLCGGTFAKTVISRHLAACIESKLSGKPAGRAGRSGKPYLHITVEGRYAPHYWLHLAAPAEWTLGDLDSVLREIWLECCGHMSAFRIGGARQQRSPWGDFGSGDEDESMSQPIGEALHCGDRFTHEYDFGTMTELKGRVLAELAPVFPKRKVHLLARNAAPDIRCDECGKAATQVCSECLWNGAGALCDECAKTHACGEEMLMPVVNSPRMGVCGYCGPSKEP